MQQATCEAAVKNEMRKPFRMTRGICNSLRGALRKPKKDEPVQFSAIDDGFEIRRPFIERNLYIVALRQTDAARAISQKRILLRPADKHVTEAAALDIVFEMGIPKGCAYHRRARANNGIGKAHAVSRGAILDMLVDTIPGAMICRTSHCPGSIGNRLRTV